MTIKHRAQQIVRWMVRHLPEIILLVIGMILAIRGVAPQGNDAAEYDALTRSILHGQYAIDPGIPTMFREPGYPLFRAIIFAVGGNWQAVFFVQIALAIMTVIFWRKNWALLDAKNAWIGAWGTMLAYGYWLMMNRTGYEILLGALLAVGMYGAQRFLQTQKVRWAVMAGIALGYLSLTRGVFLLLPFFLTTIFFLHAGGWKKFQVLTDVKKGMVLFLFFALAIPGVWMTRNAIRFHTFSLASRPGIVLYARAITLDSGWEGYFTTSVSAVFGQAIEQHLFPKLTPPMVYAQDTLTWNEYEKDLVTTHQDSQAADAMMYKEAKSIIFASPNSVARYIAWTGIEELRLYGLPSPRALDVSVEPIFANAPLRLVSAQMLALIGFIVLQWLWWIGAAYGLYAGFQKYGLTFLMGVPVVYLILVHAPLDNVARFSATVQPIVGSLILLAIVTGYRWLKSLTRASTS